MKITQLIIDVYGCDYKILNSDKILFNTLKSVVRAINATLVEKLVHKYRPQGVDVVLLLAESHISIFTWPEFGYAAIEVFLCNEKMNPFKAWKVIRKSLKPRKFKIQKQVHLVAPITK